MVIYSGFSHEKWWFSIAMLNYQRVVVNGDENPAIQFAEMKDRDPSLRYQIGDPLHPMVKFLQIIWHSIPYPHTHYISSLCPNHISIIVAIRGYSPFHFQYAEKKIPSCNQT